MRVAERMNRTLVEASRSNIAWFGHKPDVNDLRVFGGDTKEERSILKQRRPSSLVNQRIPAI